MENKQLPNVKPKTVDVEIAGNTYTLHKSTLGDLSEIDYLRQQLHDKKYPVESMMVKLAMKALYLSMKRVYSDTTEEYVDQLLDVSEINTDELMNVMEKIGFTNPQTTKKEEKEVKEEMLETIEKVESEQ